MKRLFSAAVCLCLIAGFGGCKTKTGIDPSRLEGAGVVFLIPIETGSSDTGKDRIDYRGESVKALTDGKTLTVDGKSYGELKRGDEVNLREKGRVLVNGAPRQVVP